MSRYTRSKAARSRRATRASRLARSLSVAKEGLQWRPTPPIFPRGDSRQRRERGPEPAPVQRMAAREFVIRLEHSGCSLGGPARRREVPRFARGISMSGFSIAGPDRASETEHEPSRKISPRSSSSSTRVSIELEGTPAIPASRKGLSDTGCRAAFSTAAAVRQLMELVFRAGKEQVVVLLGRRHGNVESLGRRPNRRPARDLRRYAGDRRVQVHQPGQEPHHLVVYRQLVVGEAVDDVVEDPHAEARAEVVFIARS